MKSQPDFTSLWNLLVAASKTSGNERLQSTLMNHSSKKEYICRKLGVISGTDINRYKIVSKKTGNDKKVLL
jgi:hypothetical protein